MTQSHALLGQILGKIQEKGPQALVVFDLDSTLFDVSPRTRRILSEFAEEPAHLLRFPQSIELLRKVQIKSIEWGMLDAFKRLGLDRHPTDFQNAVREYWFDKFFSGDYLNYDVPLEGAVEFTQQVEKAGARLVYLTGRSFQMMSDASKNVLAKHGFPAGELVLKEDTTVEDALFKADWFTRQALASYEVIFFFENEPLNLTVLAERHPDVDVVFVETTHSGACEALNCWPRIPNFRML